MKSFEIACERALDDWIDSIEELPEVEYSKNHIKKINSIAGGKRIFNVYVTKTLFRALVAAIIILSLSIVGFAVKEAVESKMILNLHGSSFEIENPVILPVTNLEYGYIPEGFVLDTNQSEFEKRYEEKQRFIVRRFDNGNKCINIYKGDEYTSFSQNEYDKKIMERINDDGTNYLLFEYGDENCYLAWNANGYIYIIFANVSKEEALKIAKEVR